MDNMKEIDKFLENYNLGAYLGLNSKALGNITTNKASGGDGIAIELFQILKDDAVKLLHTICQQIWKIQQWSQDWKRSVFIPIPKKGNGTPIPYSCLENPMDGGVWWAAVHAKGQT